MDEEIQIQTVKLKSIKPPNHASTHRGDSFPVCAASRTDLICEPEIFLTADVSTCCMKSVYKTLTSVMAAFTVGI